ncbi:hypothetical protein EJB05_19361, partial [Eragrostis curvula]
MADASFSAQEQRRADGATQAWDEGDYLLYVQVNKLRRSPRLHLTYENHHHTKNNHQSNQRSTYRQEHRSWGCEQTQWSKEPRLWAVFPPLAQVTLTAEVFRNAPHSPEAENKCISYKVVATVVSPSSFANPCDGGRPCRLQYPLKIAECACHPIEMIINT